MPDLDKISAARLANTLEWANKACQEALDLAFDAPNNPGLESLEEPADAVAEALRWLIAATRRLSPATTAKPPRVTQPERRQGGRGRR